MLGPRRVIGLLLSLAVFGALVALGLRSGASDSPPAADLRNGQVFIQDNLWSTPERQYGVWVGPDGTPYAGSRPSGGGRWNVVDLAALDGNPLGAPTARDEHNVYVVGVDARGGVHVAGNMHGDPLRYVRSGGELTDWRRGPAPTASSSTTYPAFTSLPDGTLLFWRRVGVAGQGRIVLDSLGPRARRWRSLGTVLDGLPSEESPYLSHIATDPRTGTIHIMFQWRSASEGTTTNDLGYARSRDGGRTFETSDGTPLRTPITHADAETVIDTAPAGSGLQNQGGLTVDAKGRPHGAVAFTLPGGGEAFEHVWLEGGEWRRERLEDLGLEGRPQLAGTADGRVWLLGAEGSALQAIDVTPGSDRLPEREIGRAPVGWEVSFDSQALARDGVVQMMIPDGSAPHVVGAGLTEG